MRRLVGRLLKVSLRPIAADHSLESVNLKHDAENSSKLGHSSFQTNTASIVQWQFDQHKGFIYAFVDIINNGPLMHLQATWQKLRTILDSEKEPVHTFGARRSILCNRLLVFFGDSDAVVVGSEISKDLVQLLGDEKRVECHYLSGGHGFPYHNSGEIVARLSKFWVL